ncbi:MAG: protein-L-isoaspartate(D-aspartate) O-methyltransferase [Phycisphaerales bacterium]|nr:MAG: protein-L-isoaspartate(D-aspartate) O-methyltransferase [Phycisphaerales bacterium]
MAAKDRKSNRSRDHLAALFFLVVLLCLWLASRISWKSSVPWMAEAQNVEDVQKTATAPADQQPPSRPTHDHPAFGERLKDRQAMVVRQIQARDIKDPNVLKAMRTVPRHAFVPPSQQRDAYQDHPLPIGKGQTISQPYIVAFMTEALRLDPNSNVLEIGTGSGYQAAVCAEIARHVYTIEIVEPLATAAAQRLKTLGYPNVQVKAGDGYHGWPEKGPFDAIIGTAAAQRIPPALLEQLAPGGRMILPVGDTWGFQHLILITKDLGGTLRRRQVMPVRFVPMTGRVQEPAGESDR